MMTTVAFTDADGVKGYVTETLEVEYQGQWAEEVRESIEEIRDEHSSSNGEVSVEDVGNSLVIGLPEDAPIIEIERVDEVDATLE